MAVIAAVWLALSAVPVAAQGIGVVPNVHPGSSPGPSVTHAVTGQILATVTLVKNTVGGDGRFTFITDVPGLGSDIQTAGGTGQTSASDVPAGTYSIVETVPAGWRLTSATCSDGSPPNALVLGAGEAVTCTFVDTRDGQIVVEKMTFPAGSPQSFLFALAGLGVNQWFSLTDAAGPRFSGFLTPGFYSVAELPQVGWELTSETCTGEPGTVNENPAAIDLNPGEVVACLFANTQNGSIEVVKLLSDTGPVVELFSFSSNFNGMFNLQGDLATTGPISVTPGTGYTVSEDDPAADGWTLTGATCSDGSNPLTSIDVSPGEAVVCTFTNAPTVLIFASGFESTPT